MARTMILALAVVLPNSAVAQSFQDENLSTGVGPWRERAPNHYNSGECCYCREVTGARGGKTAGVSEYQVDGTWYEIPDAYIKQALPGRPPEWITICDPLQKKYLCVIFGAGA